jgi:hypothetical protein
MPPKQTPSEKKQPVKKETTNKTKKAPTAYNIFMKKEIENLKKENPNMDHKERFKLAAQNWSKQKK